MKSSVLQILSAVSPDPVSGQKISKELGVSRVAIWKQIQRLQNLGYPIQSTSKGYYLKKQADCLYSWEFPELKDRVFYYPRLKSTMDQAKHHALDGCSDFSIVIADRQDEGRGRLNRDWESRKGGLYFTMILRPEIPPAIIHQLSFMASVSLVEVLRENYQIKASIKWPNDILVGHLKICGILCEMEVEADLVKYLNIGIGMNINYRPRIKGTETICIKDLVGKTVSRKTVLNHFIHHFQNQIKTQNFQSIIDQWRRYSATLNRQVKIETTKTTIIGKAVEINESGALTVETGPNQYEKIYFGDCFHLD